MNALIGMLEGHRVLFMVLSGVSLAVFAGSLAGVPWIIGKLPQDHFMRRERPVPARMPGLRPRLLAVVKNGIGGLILTAGIVMLFTPGQGLLTMVIGLALMDFPGKQRLEAALLAKKSVRRALNWIRLKQGATPFRFD